MQAPIKKTGRKLLPDNQKRTNRVVVRLTDHEFTELEKVRHKVPRGTYIRNLAFREENENHIPKLNIQAFKKLAPMANNLNQLARHANQTGLIEDITKTQKALAVLRAELMGVSE